LQTVVAAKAGRFGRLAPDSGQNLSDVTTPTCDVILSGGLSPPSADPQCKQTSSCKLCCRILSYHDWGVVVLASLQASLSLSLVVTPSSLSLSVREGPGKALCERPDDAIRFNMRLNG
jgi:hypothetical protein